MLALSALGSPAAAQTAPLAGSWDIDPAAGTAIDPWSRIHLDITIDGDAITIGRTFSAGRRVTSQVYPLKLGETVAVPVKWWAGNRHIGAYMGGDMTEKIRADWMDGGQTLKLESHYILSTSQGETPVRSTFEYRLSPDGRELTVIELRSSRNKPVVHVFHRS